jgi:hypothetical protein
MLHLHRSTTPARPRRTIVAALAFALVSLLVLAAPIGVAAKGPSITLTADRQTVNAGDNVTLKIKLQNVTNATLNGAALPGGQDQVDEKVLVCATTTYTVAALPTGGGPKISQALTITASGTTTKAACASPAPAPNPLPDLAVASLTVSQSYDPKVPDVEKVHIDYTIENRGQAPAANLRVDLYVNGKDLDTFSPPLLKAGQKFTRSNEDLRQDGEQLTYSLVLDPDNTIVESDKTNNTAAANISVVLGQNPNGIFSDKIDNSGQGPNILKFIKP